MAIEDIEQVDDLSGGGHPAGGVARAMRITTDGGRLETPARMVSYGEQAARSDIPLSRALPTELAMDFRVVHAEAVAALAAGGDRRERAASRLGRRTRVFRDITERALLRMSVLQPSAGALSGMSAPARVRFADAQAELLRAESGGGLVAYPYLGLRAADYLRFVRDRHEQGGDGAALFVLDMGMDGATMEKMLAYFRNWRGPVLVPIIYRGASRSLRGRAAIGRYLGSPRMAFLACQVPREMPAGGGSVSGVHAACFQQGFDLAAPAQRSRPPPPPPPQRMPPRPGAPKAAAPARLFSPETWQIEPLADALASRGMRIVDEFLLNEHNGFDRRLITTMLGGCVVGGRKGRNGRSPEAYGPPLLRQLARVHEAISSSAEFGRMRAVISEREPGAAAPEIAIPPLVPG